MKNLKPIIKNLNLIRVKKKLKIQSLIDQYNLNTICKSGLCPNLGECWGNGVATFLILGSICTRSCKFCGVSVGKPEKIKWEEVEKIARSIKLMKVQHVIITSVDRDDLNDRGSFLWIETIQSIRRLCINVTIETLIPDFKGNLFLLEIVSQTHPQIITHNLETVRRLSYKIRTQACYDRSLEILFFLKIKRQYRIKSSIMLGIGENEKEIIETMKSFKGIKLDIITIGQYLQPSIKHFSIKKIINNLQFKNYKFLGIKMGFRHSESAPFVRSSYHAKKHLL